MQKFCFGCWNREAAWSGSAVSVPTHAARLQPPQQRRRLGLSAVSVAVIRVGAQCSPWLRVARPHDERGGVSFHTRPTDLRGGRAEADVIKARSEVAFSFGVRVCPRVRGDHWRLWAGAEHNLTYILKEFHWLSDHTDFSLFFPMGLHMGLIIH